MGMGRNVAKSMERMNGETICNPAVSKVSLLILTRTIVRLKSEIICNHLRWGRRRLRARGSWLPAVAPE